MFTGIILFAYLYAGYWAVNKVLFANRVLFGPLKDIFYTKLFLALVFGWILIPIALIKVLVLKK